MAKNPPNLVETLMTIKEAAQYSGISEYTLRYYERAGLLESVHRNAGGHRRYASADIERLGFLTCLRATGMPIQQLREFVAQMKAGKSGMQARLDMLLVHKQAVQSRMVNLQQLLKVIDQKINYYQTEEV